MPLNHLSIQPRKGRKSWAGRFYKCTGSIVLANEVREEKAKDSGLFAWQALQWQTRRGPINRSCPSADRFFPVLGCSALLTKVGRTIVRSRSGKPSSKLGTVVF